MLRINLRVELICVYHESCYTSIKITLIILKLAKVRTHERIEMKREKEAHMF